MLLPNNKQQTKLHQYAGAARFAYNWAITREQGNYKNGNKFLSDNDLRKEFTQLKKQEEFQWLNTISNNVPKQAIKDACNAYSNFFKKNSSYPKFKNKKTSTLSFYQDVVKIQFSETHVKLEGFSSSKKPNKQKLNWVKLAEKNRIPLGVKYSNPRVTFDGIHWWISIGIEYEELVDINKNDGIGIDLGIKELAVCSNGSFYKNINKEEIIKKLKKKHQQLQRKTSKKYSMNKNNKNCRKTRNIIKSEKELLKLNHRLTNIRQNYLHQTTSEIIKQTPIFVVLEDLDIRKMLKNKHIAKAIQEQKLYEFFRQIRYKCEWNNIEFIMADKWFPSSKLCSECGCVNKNLKLSDRTYICPECGNTIDRDYQAALNLKRYGEQILKSAA